MKKYKVCRLVNGRVVSPFQEYEYGLENELLGRELEFEFDDSMEECSRGFYATDAEGIIYSLNKDKDCVVYEVEVGGNKRLFDEYKQRFSKSTFIRRLSDEETRSIIEEQSKKMDWNYYEACYPVDPRKIDAHLDKEKVLKLLKEWDSTGDSVEDSVWASVRYSIMSSVRDSVWDSVWDSVEDSVWNSVRDSVWNSVRDSVRDSVWGSVWGSVSDFIGAYLSSLFPQIKKWKYIDHAEGVNPFQAGIDMWSMGLVPTFDGKTWRIHKGKNMEVVLEISREELRKA